ncbi:MAG: hypothetical protein WBQ34_07915 [Candidatus Acidiferrales bacterium]
MSSRRLPDGYLELCSLDALESLVLARMNQAANLRAQAQQLLQRWVEVEAEVKVAQWMLDQRRSDQLRAGAAAQMQTAQSCLDPLRPAALPAFAASPHAEAPFAFWSNSLSRQYAPSQKEQSGIPIADGANRLCLRNPALAIRALRGGPTTQGGVVKWRGLNRSPGCVRAECSLVHGPSKAQIGAGARHLPAAS